MDDKMNKSNSDYDDKITKGNIEKSSNNFNELMNKYVKLYKLLIEQVLKNQTNPVLEKFAGKNVKLVGSDNKFFYINKFGFSQESTDFAKRPITCASPAIPITPEEFVLFPKGNVLGINVDCGLEGSNILDSDNNSYSWINNAGNRLLYSKEVWSNRSLSCQDVMVKNVNSNNLKNFDSFGDMKKDSVCTRLNIDPKLVQDIEDLNKKLSEIGKNMIIDINKLSEKDGKLSKDLEKTLNQVKNKVSELNRDRMQIQNGDLDFGDKFNPNLEELRRDTGLRVTSNFTRFLVLLVVCFLLVGLTFYTVMYDNQSILAQGIIALVCLFAIYNLTRLLFSAIF